MRNTHPNSRESGFCEVANCATAPKPAGQAVGVSLTRPQPLMEVQDILANSLYKTKWPVANWRGNPRRKGASGEKRPGAEAIVNGCRGKRHEGTDLAPARSIPRWARVLARTRIGRTRLFTRR
jgi:hypothetical protein